MKTTKIKLTSIKDVRDFVDIMTAQTIEIDLTSGRYTVDAKSIMGIFALDLLSPITLVAHGTDEECDKLMAQIAPFIIR